jgi:hypothetical protein
MTYAWQSSRPEYRVCPLPPRAPEGSVRSFLEHSPSFRPGLPLPSQYAPHDPTGFYKARFRNCWPAKLDPHPCALTLGNHRGPCWVSRRRPRRGPRSVKNPVPCVRSWQVACSISARQARAAIERASFNPLVQGSTPWRPTCGYTSYPVLLGQFRGPMLAVRCAAMASAFSG